MNPRHVFIAIGFVLMWSSGFIGAELGTRAGSPLALLAWRFAIIAFLVTPWLLTRRRLRGRQLWHQVVVGVLTQAGYLHGVVAAASAGVPAGTSALIAAFQPVVATVAAGLFLKHATSMREWTGLIIGLAGTAIVVAGDVGGSAAPLWAYALPLAAMLALVGGTLVDQRRPQSDAGGLGDCLAVQCITSAALFVPLAGLRGELAPPEQPVFWMAVAWVIILSTVGGYGFYWLAVRRLGMTKAATLLYLTPPVSAIWAAVTLGQPITAATVTGMAVSAVGVGFVLAPRAPATPRLEPEKTTVLAGGGVVPPPPREASLAFLFPRPRWRRGDQTVQQRAGGFGYRLYRGVERLLVGL